jgi:ferredoxin--NADP+ reductase
VVGWAKRGPSGVIGTNKPDAAATVAAMLEDLPRLPAATDDSPIADLLHERQIEYVTYAGWCVLNAHEAALGAAQGRPRVKVVRIPEMLTIIRNGLA